MHKSVLVTGAGRGIGQVIALRLAKEGYRVFGCARTLKQLEETRRLSEGRIEIDSVDVTDEKACERWIAKRTDNNIPWGLVTAAGSYGAIGPFTVNSWQEWKSGIELNLFGSLLPAKIFSQLLIKRGLPGRIVFLSGGGATKPLPNLTNYCAAKAAIVRVAETLALELAPHKITVNSLAPGAIATELTKRVLEAGPELAGAAFFDQTKKQFEGGSQSPEPAANLTAYLLSEKGEQVTGKLISAIWDPWEQMHERPDVLANREELTLRRTVPKDFNRP